MDGNTGDTRFNWMAIKLTVAISVVFLFQMAYPQITNMFALDSSMYITHPWTLVTYIFMHGSYTHLYSNMFALALFGSLLEKVIGYRNFLKIFFVSGIFSGFVGTFFYGSIIGASGAIFGAMGALAVLRPKMNVWAIGVPMPMIVAIAAYALIDLGGLFYPSDIAHIGHISAMIFGVIVGFMWRSKYPEPHDRKKHVLNDEKFKQWEDKYMRKKKFKRKGDLIIFDDNENS